MPPFLKEVQMFVEDCPEMTDEVKVSGDGRCVMTPDASRAFGHWRDTHRPMPKQGGHHGE